jgi:hypothetical protein
MFVVFRVKYSVYLNKERRIGRGGEEKKEGQEGGKEGQFFKMLFHLTIPAVLFDSICRELD